MSCLQRRDVAYSQIPRTVVVAAAAAVGPWSMSQINTHQQWLRARSSHQDRSGLISPKSWGRFPLS